MTEEAMAKCPLFEGLDEEKRLEAAQLLDAHISEYRKGDFLRRESDLPKWFGLVLSGTVQALSDDIDGNVMIMANVTSGETFGESLCFLGIADSPVYIRAFTDCRVMWMSIGRLGQCGDPLSVRLLHSFASMLASRALSMNDRIQILSKSTIREKLMTFLTQCSHKAGGKTFSIPFDRASLAAYLGTNRSALSRELSAMQKDGIIEFYRDSFRILI